MITPMFRITPIFVYYALVFSLYAFILQVMITPMFRITPIFVYQALVF